MLHRYSVFHQASYILKGGKGISTKSLVELAECDIPEIGGHEAPIVLRWSKPVRIERQLVLARLDARFLNGRFLVPHSYAKGMDEEVFQFNDTAADHLSKATHIATQKQLSATLPAFSKVEFFLGSDRERSLERRRAQAENLVIVDGKVYTSCDEPTFLIEPLDGLTYDSVGKLYTRAPRYTVINGEVVFGGIDKFRLASVLDVQNVQDELRVRHGEDHVRYLFRDLDVVDPTVFHLIDDLRHAAGPWVRVC